MLAHGNQALPLAWRALASGASAERRAALALLAWFRDRRSIFPIVEAFDSTRGALTRQQLLFDLNAILLTEAPELGDAGEIDVLAVQHLTRVLDDSAGIARTGSSRSGPLPCRKAITVYPRGISRDFRAQVGALTAHASASPDMFDAALRTTGNCGVAFHAVRTAHDVARVASTFFKTGWPDMEPCVDYTSPPHRRSMDHNAFPRSRGSRRVAEQSEPVAGNRPQLRRRRSAKIVVSTS